MKLNFKRFESKGQLLQDELQLWHPWYTTNSYHLYMWISKASLSPFEGMQSHNYLTSIKMVSSQGPQSKVWLAYAKKLRSQKHYRINWILSCKMFTRWHNTQVFWLRFYCFEFKKENMLDVISHTWQGFSIIA